MRVQGKEGREKNLGFETSFASGQSKHHSLLVDKMCTHVV